MKLKAFIKPFSGHTMDIVISGNTFPERSTHPSSDRYVLETEVGSLSLKPIGDLEVENATASRPLHLVVYLNK